MVFMYTRKDANNIPIATKSMKVILYDLYKTGIYAPIDFLVDCKRSFYIGVDFSVFLYTIV